ncbi:MAG: helix-turn-helix domain-containing protein [Hydrogenophaga sp.]|jgi:transcriptional regulator with XRE-family HTH domain|uniref:helix-turn-helix domain-containing protein n=1 Tax=unclassified Hydrogenophaga TaxID=2610897 RepID=UPI0036D29F18
MPKKPPAPTKTAPPPPPAARGAPTARSFRLGEHVRRIRADKELTLEEVARRGELARSTLSKIENEQTSPTFEVLLKLATGLGVPMDELLAPRTMPPPSGRRSITRAGQGRQHTATNYTHEFLCTDLTHKNVVPSKARVHARSTKDFPDWVRHDGDDFMIVLEGAVELHTEFYEPTVLNVGDSAYFDARMGHLCISVSPEDALVLWVPTHTSDAEVMQAIGRSPAI